MLAEILELEKTFDSLLPLGQQQERTNALLIETGKQWSQAIWQKAKHLGGLPFSQQTIEDAFNFSERAIFICGSERSGTTLLRNLLDAHPQLSVLPSEGTYITQLEKKLLHLPQDDRCEFLCREWLWRMVLSMHQPPFWLLGKSTVQHSPYLDFARAFIGWWPIVKERCRHSNTQWPFVVLQLAFATSQHQTGSSLQQLYWVEKTPNNEQHLDRILQDFPKAKIIQTIRNPIDVLRSNKPHEALSTVSKYSFIRNLKASFNIAGKQLLRKDKYHLLVRYEDLCAKPVLTMQQVAAFIGINYIDELLLPTVVGKPTGPNSSFKQTGASGKIIAAKDRVQEDKLTVKDHQLLAASLHGVTETFGYYLPPIGMVHKQLLRVDSFAQRVLNKLKRIA